jgi:hypothetical protein
MVADIDCADRLLRMTLAVARAGAPPACVCIRHSASKCALVLKRECVIEGFKYVRMKFIKRGQIINLSEKISDVKNYP